MRWIILVFLLFAAPAHADRDAVRCVQKQLAELGHDPGPIDGAVGPKTRAAFANLNAQRDTPVYDKILSRRSALVVCRELGLTDIRLSRLWPEYPRRFRVRSSAEIPRGTRDLVATLTRQYLTEMEFTLGIKLAKPVAIFVSSDRNAILDEMSQTVSGSAGRTRSRQYLKTVCGPKIEFGGFANRDRVFICLADPETDFGTNMRSDSDRVRQNRVALRHVVQHEVVHAAQFQLVGEVAYLGGAKVSRFGPDWLGEGSAELLSVLSLHEYSVPRYVAAKILAGDDNKRFTLKSLEAKSENPEKARALYFQGFIASKRLVGDDNYKGLLEFYRLIGLGQPWREAFEMSFGVPVSLFYKAYPEG